VKKALEGVRVALVEDEFMIAEELAEILVDEGAEVAGPFSNLPRALEMMNTERVDVALLDVNLGGTPIYPVATLLAERGIPFVFMTGYSPDVLPEEHRARPMIRKPFRAADLITLLGSVVTKVGA
jgi:CheY-like chemotaxis protein